MGAETDEINRAEELLELLQEKFGQHAKLLLVIDYQGPGAVGPCVVDGYEKDLLLCYHDTDQAPSVSTPYGEPVMKALTWAVGQKIKTRRLKSVDAAFAMAKPIANQCFMFGDPAFTAASPSAGKGGIHSLLDATLMAQSLLSRIRDL